jgi:hypothetical protein
MTPPGGVLPDSAPPREGVLAREDLRGLLFARPAKDRIIRLGLVRGRGKVAVPVIAAAFVETKSRVS